MKKAGFTLIEVIIVLALTVIIIGIASSMFTTGNRIFSDSDAKSTLQMQAQTIEEDISKYGMQAVGIASITDEFGNQITEVPYRELTLTDINGVNSENNEWLAINEMTIDYIEDEINMEVSTTAAVLLKYDRNERRISTKDKELQGEVISVKIKPIDIENPEGTFKNTNSVVISITLKRKIGFADVTYPVLITVKFRNNFLR